MKDGNMYVQNDGLSFTKQIDGLTIMNTETGAYYRLSETAAFIWEHLGKPTSLSQVKKSTATRYEVSIQDVGMQVEAFIGEMAAEGLIKLTNLNNKKE